MTMKEVGIGFGLAFAAFAAFGWPTLDEVEKVKPMVVELMSSKESQKPDEAADAAMAFAAEAKSEAARFLLFRRAVELYARAGEDDKASNAFVKMLKDIKNVPPAMQEKIALDAGRALAKTSRPVRMEAIYKGVRVLVWAEKELTAARTELRKSKKDAPDAHLRAGNALAVMGDWPKALDHLLGAKGKIAPVADHEINGTATADKLANAWWKASTLAEEEYVKSAYRLHAAELYRRALAANLLEGLTKTLAEDRIAEVEKENEVDPVANLSDLANQDKVKVRKVQLWEGGPYWAEMNIGATKPEECGYCFWWGDTVGYKRENDAWVASDGSGYKRENGAWVASDGSVLSDPFGKTCHKNLDKLKSKGWISEDGVLAPEHDAAHVHWGGNWRMPTKQEADDLVKKCDWTRTTQNGVNGYVVKGRGVYSSASIFLPSDSDTFSVYWLSAPHESNGIRSWGLEMGSKRICRNEFLRADKNVIRPVQSVAK